MFESKMPIRGVAAAQEERCALRRRIIVEFRGSLAQWKDRAKQVKCCDDRKSRMK